MLVHGNQPEMLRELVVEWMKRYPLAPLENEIILVQSNGIAQWLKLALAAAEDLRVPLPLASLLRDRFLRLLAQGGEKLDWSAIGQLAAEDAGTTAG